MSVTEILTLTVSIVCPVCSLIIAMVTMFNKNKKDIKQDEQKHGALVAFLNQAGTASNSVSKIIMGSDKLALLSDEDKAIATNRVGP